MLPLAIAQLKLYRGPSQVPFFIMTSISSLTELEAINQVLVAIGQGPVDTLDNTNPDVAVVQTTLSQVSRDVQAEGWSFNRQSNYPLQPDQNENIKYPDNALQIDFTWQYSGSAPIHYGIDSEGFLYDKNRTPRSEAMKWGTRTVYCDVVFLYEWIDLPQPMKSYIVARTSVIVSSRIVGDPQQYQMLAQYEAQCRAYVMEYETEQGDYSYFGSPDEGNYYRSYKPFHALYR